MTGNDFNEVKSLINVLGCTKEEDIYLAYYVYQELTQVRVYFNVSYQYNKDLNLLYLSGQRVPNDKYHYIFIPLPINFKITPKWINKVFSTLNQQSSLFSIILSFVHKDSSIIFNRIDHGLLPPLSPDTTKKLDKQRIKEKTDYIKSSFDITIDQDIDTSSNTESNKQ